MITKGNKGMVHRLIVILLAGAIIIGFVGCGEDTPDRDQIPIIKKRLYELQEAIASKNLAAIDSLLSPKILTYNESSDSLVKFCFNPDGSFAFDRLGNCDIRYAHKKAVVDCILIDSTGQKGKPIHLSFVKQHKMWLLSRFDIGDTTTVQHE